MVNCVALLLLLHVYFILLLQAFTGVPDHCLKKSEWSRQVLHELLNLFILKDVLLDIGVPLAEQRFKLLNV